MISRQPSKLLIDITRLLDRVLRKRRFTGIDRVGLAYIAHFYERACALVRFGRRWLVLGQADSITLFKGLLKPTRTFRKQVRWLIGKNYALNWRQPAAGSILLNTGHSGLNSVEYGMRVVRSGLRAFYFLHDLIPVLFPEYGRPGEEEKHHQRLHTMCRTGTGLILNSADTARQLEAYAHTHRLTVPPYVVAHLAPTAFPPPLAHRPLVKPYFVVLGTIEPRKNHLLLLNLWRRLVNEWGTQAPCLVVIGQRGWECEQVVDMLERCPALHDSVIELGTCDDATLANWLAHAQALLFPSFAEGYGMPLVEALSMGVPVIASDLPVFRELAGNIPEYLDPLDGISWYRTIRDYVASDSERRAAQKARMLGWQTPTWEAHFSKVDNLIGY